MLISRSYITKLQYLHEHYFRISYESFIFTHYKITVSSSVLFESPCKFRYYTLQNYTVLTIFILNSLSICSLSQITTLTKFHQFEFAFPKKKKVFICSLKTPFPQVFNCTHCRILCGHGCKLWMQRGRKLIKKKHVTSSAVQAS